MPPEDFIFEELQPGMEVKANPLRKMSRSLSNLSNQNTNNFQRKRELEKKISIHEFEEAKGNLNKLIVQTIYNYISVQKEMKALQMMIETYTQSPAFGNAKQFQGEHETALHKCQVLESELNAFKTELGDVASTLENIRTRSPSMARKNSSQSLVSSSSSSNKSDTIDRRNAKISNTDNLTLATGWQDDDDWDDSNELSPQTPVNHSITIPVPPPMKGSSSIPSPPPPPPLIVTPKKEEEPQPPKVVALYQYDADTPDTISMGEGEQFIVIDEDQGGWTKVQRVDTQFYDDIGEGFVPTSFIQKM